MKHIVSLLLFLLASTLQADGFLAGTLVKTPTGYTPIETLKIGDPVSCYDEMLRETESTIVSTKQSYVQQYLEVTIDGATLGTTRDQKFLVPLDTHADTEQMSTPSRSLHETTLEAHDISPDSTIRISHIIPTLFGRNGCAIVRSLRYINAPAIMYDLALKQHHNFFVSTQDVLTHNFAVEITICTWGAGKIAWLGIGALATAIAAAAAREVTLQAIDGLKGTLGTSPADTSPLSDEYHHALEVEKKLRAAGQWPAEQSQEQPNGDPNKPSDPNDPWYAATTAAGAAAGASKAKDAIETTAEYIDKTKQFLTFTQETLKASVDWTMNHGSKIQHCFHNTKHDHNFEPLLKLYTSENNIDYRRLVTDILSSANNRLPLEGQFEDIPTRLHDTTIFLRGYIMDGIVKLGTMMAEKKK